MTTSQQRATEQEDWLRTLAWDLRHPDGTLVTDLAGLAAVLRLPPEEAARKALTEPFGRAMPAALLHEVLAGPTAGTKARPVGRWEADKHPRDHQGQFIQVLSHVRLSGGATGDVTRILAGGRVEVRRSDGVRVAVNKGDVTVLRPPALKGEALQADLLRRAAAAPNAKQRDALTRLAERTGLAEVPGAGLVVAKGDRGEGYLLRHLATGLGFSLTGSHLRTAKDAQTLGARWAALRSADGKEPFPDVTDQSVLAAWRAADGRDLRQALEDVRADFDREQGLTTSWSIDIQDRQHAATADRAARAEEVAAVTQRLGLTEVPADDRSVLPIGERITYPYRVDEGSNAVGWPLDVRGTTVWVTGTVSGPPQQRDRHSNNYREFRTGYAYPLAGAHWETADGSQTGTITYPPTLDFDTAIYRPGAPVAQAGPSPVTATVAAAPGVPTRVERLAPDGRHVKAVEAARAALPADRSTLGWRVRTAENDSEAQRLASLIEVNTESRDRWQQALDTNTVPAGGTGAGQPLGSVLPNVIGERSYPIQTVTRAEAIEHRDSYQSTIDRISRQRDEYVQALTDKGVLGRREMDVRGLLSDGQWIPSEEMLGHVTTVKKAGKALDIVAQQRISEREGGQIEAAYQRFHEHQLRVRELTAQIADLEQHADNRYGPEVLGLGADDGWLALRPIKRWRQAGDGDDALGRRRMREHSARWTAEPQRELDALLQVGDLGYVKDHEEAQWRSLAIRRDVYREVLGEVRPMGSDRSHVLGTPVLSAELNAGDRLLGPRGTAVDVASVTVSPAGDTVTLTFLDGVEQSVPATATVFAAYRGHADLTTAVQYAEGFYPQDWIERAIDAGPLGLDQDPRGQYNFTQSLMLLSDPEVRAIDGAPPRGRVAIHEMGHRMESLNPGVMAMEWAYQFSRTAPRRNKRYAVGYNVHAARKPEQALSPIKGQDASEVGRDDAYRSAYSGKEYGGKPDTPYELLTTGVESLFAGADYLDEDMRHWLLGLLGLL